MLTIGLLFIFLPHLDANLVLLLLKCCSRYSERVWVCCYYPTPLQCLLVLKEAVIVPPRLPVVSRFISVALCRVDSSSLAVPLSDFMAFPLVVFFLLLPLEISRPMPVLKSVGILRCSSLVLFYFSVYSLHRHLIYSCCCNYFFGKNSQIYISSLGLLLVPDYCVPLTA